MRQNNDWKNLQLQNSQKEADGTDYIGNMNWNIALTLNNKLGNMTLNPRQFIDFKELLEDHVREDSWIDVTSFNRQGLPTKKAKAQKLYYYSPIAGRVAGFVAYSDWAVLYCDWDPTDSDSSLGVRPVRKKI